MIYSGVHDATCMEDLVIQDAFLSLSVLTNVAVAMELISPVSIRSSAS
jgi:hypothetical protein